jgi:type IV secretory pathway VirB4 component
MSKIGRLRMYFRKTKYVNQFYTSKMNFSSMIETKTYNCMFGSTSRVTNIDSTYVELIMVCLISQ